MNAIKGAGSAMAGSANAELHLRGKRLLLMPVPVRVIDGWNSRLAQWAGA